VYSCEASPFHCSPLFCDLKLLQQRLLDLLLTHARASGVAVSVVLYHLPLLTAACALVQQVLSLPFANDSFASHLSRTCGHVVLCVLSISKFHASMAINDTWREGGCGTDNFGSLGVEFVLHVASLLMYLCMSASNWLPSPVEAEPESHDHVE
jgi:hypothetical protein